MTPDDPMTLLCEDGRRAAGDADPLAHRCILATRSEDGHPSLRTLVLRGLDRRNIVLFFNATSAKWRHLQSDPRYELLVYWPTRNVQYRIRGEFEHVPHAEMAVSWQQKGATGKLLDLYYTHHAAQGSRIGGDDELWTVLQGIQAKTNDMESFEAPETLVGLRLIPAWIERLDLKTASGVYTRHVYTRTASGWQRHTLVP